MKRPPAPPIAYVAFDGTVRGWCYPEGEPHPHGPDGEAACYDCGLPYGSPPFGDLSLPDEVWAQISPRGGDGGLLCPNCTFERLSALEHEGIERGVAVWPAPPDDDFGPIYDRAGEVAPSPAPKRQALAAGRAAGAVVLLALALVAEVGAGPRTTGVVVALGVVGAVPAPVPGVAALASAVLSHDGEGLVIQEPPITAADCIDATCVASSSSALPSSAPRPAPLPTPVAEGAARPPAEGAAE